MQIRRCPSPICGRPFQLNQFDTRLKTSIERGKFTCPHCGFLFSSDINSVFLTHALSPSEEARFAADEASSQEQGAPTRTV